MLKTVNASEEEISSDYHLRTKGGPVNFIGEEPEESLSSDEEVCLDFAGALRLLSFSDRIIQPFEKKFIIDALSLTLSNYSGLQKRALAEALIRAGKISRSLADRLLLDADIVVQTLLISNYPYLSEKVLVCLAHHADTCILLHLAERRELTPPVVRALTSRGVVEVTRKVLQNKTAQCSYEIIEELIQAGLRDEAACLALLNLPDMDPALALQLFWNAPTSVRLIILKRFLKSHVLVEGHFARMQTPNLRYLPLFSVLGDQNLSIESVAQGIEAATDYFRQAQNENAFRLLALCASLPAEFLQKAAMDSGGEAMVVVLKALGLDRSKAQQFLIQLSDTPIAINWTDVAYLRDVFDMISWGEARMAVSYWLWQIHSSGPYQAAEDDRFLEKRASTDEAGFVSDEGARGE